MAIHINEFSGLAPKLTDRRSNQKIAEIAENVNLDRQTLKPFRAPNKLSDATGETLFVNDCCHITGDCATHFTSYGFGCDEIVVATNVEGFDYPVYSRANQCPPEWKRLGFVCNLPAPKVTPTSAPDFDSEDGKNFAMEERSYYFTLVNDMGWESQPSYPSEWVRTEVGEPVVITNFNIPSGTDYETINIYRASSQLDYGVEQQEIVDSVFLMVGSISKTNGTFVDDTLIPNQANVTEEYAPPPADLFSVDAFRGGRLVGLSGNTIVMSERALPYAFNSAYSIAFDESKALRLVATGRVAYVLTDGKPFTIKLNGDCKEHEQALQIQDVDEHLPIVSQRSAVAWMGGVVYASRNGLVYLREITPQVLTQDYYSHEQWKELHPHTMVGEIHEGYYYGVTDEVTIRFRLPDNIYASDASTRLTTLSLKPKAMAISEQGRLLMAFNDDERSGVYEWDEGSDYLPMHWRSRINVEKGITRYTAYKVIAEGAGNVIKHLINTRLIQTHTHTSNNPTRLPVGYRGLEYQVDITGTKEVVEYHLAPSIRELASI